MTDPQAGGGVGGTFFDAHQRATIEAAMARIIPTDGQPGAKEAGTIQFLDRYLSGLDFIYAKPDGSGFEKLEGKRADAWQQRYEAFKKTITEDYPGIRIVAEQGIREPDFFGDADRAAFVMLAANQGLNGIWAVWDVPAEGAIAAARTAGREQGMTEALLAGYGLLGKPAPAYVALPTLPVSRDNLLDAWKTVYHTEAPASIRVRMK
jgi:hypothetical protein